LYRILALDSHRGQSRFRGGQQHHPAGQPAHPEQLVDRHPGVRGDALVGRGAGDQLGVRMGHIPALVLLDVAQAEVGREVDDANAALEQRRNDRLRAEIKSLDKQIEEINSLESAKQKFIARMEIIEKLQRSRPEIVHVFDEIVKTLPDGAYLTGVKQTDLKFKFDGVAQSATRVSTFMRNIDSSVWMDNPVLQVVESAKDSPTGGSNFVLSADVVGVDLEHGGETTVKKVAAK